MYTDLQQALPRVLIHRTQVVKRNGSCQCGSALRRRATCIKRRFGRRLTKTVPQQRCSGQDQNKNLPLLNVQFVVFVFCSSFSMKKSMVRMGSWFVSVSMTFYFSHLVWRGFPLDSALEFRYCRVIPYEMCSQNLTFDDTISCITRLRSPGEVALQVAPFLRDCKGRGYRRRSRCQTENE